MFLLLPVITLQLQFSSLQPFLLPEFSSGALELQRYASGGQAHRYRTTAIFFLIVLPSA